MSYQFSSSWRRIETHAQFVRIEQVAGPYAVEGDVLDAAGTHWIWCVVEGGFDSPRVTSNPYETCAEAMAEADRLARLTRAPRRAAASRRLPPAAIRQS